MKPGNKCNRIKAENPGHGSKAARASMNWSCASQLASSRWPMLPRFLDLVLLGMGKTERGTRFPLSFPGTKAFAGNEMVGWWCAIGSASFSAASAITLTAPAG